MRRRAFIKVIVGTAVAWPLAARAQQPAKVPRIGFLRFGPASANADRVEALRAGLRDLGYVEGKNIVIEFRWAERVDQLLEFAAELVRMNVDAIFAISSTEVEPTRQATKTIPIVFAAHTDPVGVGHVASLARSSVQVVPPRARRGALVVDALLLGLFVPRARRLRLLRPDGSDGQARAVRQPD